MSKAQHTLEKWQKASPELIADECSQRHIQSVIEEAKSDIFDLVAERDKLKEINAELLEVLIWQRDALDLGAIAFYEKHGFNIAEVMPRTRAAIAKATGSAA